MYVLRLSPIVPAWAQCQPAGEGPASGAGLPGHAHDGGAEAAVQPRPEDHHVPYPRVQVVAHAPEAPDRPAVRPGGRRPRLEKVGPYEEEP